jgi:hypothetical protein
MIDQLTTVSLGDPLPDLMQNIDLVFDIVEGRFVG